LTEARVRAGRHETTRKQCLGARGTAAAASSRRARSCLKKVPRPKRAPAQRGLNASAGSSGNALLEFAHALSAVVSFIFETSGLSLALSRAVTVHSGPRPSPRPTFLVRAGKRSRIWLCIDGRFAPFGRIRLISPVEPEGLPVRKRLGGRPSSIDSVVSSGAVVSSLPGTAASIQLRPCCRQVVVRPIRMPTCAPPPTDYPPKRQVNLPDVDEASVIGPDQGCAYGALLRR